MHFNFVGDDALLALADKCPRLSTLHLVDPAADQVQDSDPGQDSGISAAALRSCFMSLPWLEDLTLDLCESVADAGPALEVLGNRCPRIKTLKLGRFQGICRAAGLHLDGVSVCGGLQSLSIKNSGDLTDAGLYTIARGCRRLSRFEIHGCGDCRTCPRPSQPFFGLTCLSIYDKLSKMKLDCGDAIGYAFTAPMGHMDLSSWERFYLNGIGSLESLYELDYWPPQDREVNQRSLSLPAAGLIQGCAGLRKLFVHGTAHEHFMKFFLKIPGLRDVQLREDYYPAPEDDMSTEMRVDSCSRFEDALHGRGIPD
ncbi:uncharacterized protein A4U43_C06F13030 [Asparagus officinalis]|uniref:COI1 F-box domain-containing protein n=1 Tax=Asparagus officinalis TaxID=4686 RepID=A0A5P1ELL0_ASPOF|nr:uncharacterized protein A4U43_C06F13030 [Asparagus officinalis]